MKLKSLPFYAIILLFFSCSDGLEKEIPSNFNRILTDTTNNHRAKWDLDQIAHYNSICEEIGLNKLYDGAESLEIRAWQQTSFFGMGTDEEIYSLKFADSIVHMTFYRIYCRKGNYDNDTYKTWNAFTEAKVDSFIAISKTFPSSIIDSLHIDSIWSLKSQSALEIPDNIRFTDGTTTSIEIANKEKYKLIKHHVAYAYYEKTKNENIKDFMNFHERVIRHLQVNKVYYPF
ncbi:MAG: hypothetical protein H7Y86_22505 [Rhizobacter sp.]|nr:hypothetical protein [Ferruginibacter sp.]